jgi:8-oxo-dGTP pyrophosphatase MutT (NUDIX family)
MKISVSKGAGIFFYKRLQNGDVLVALGKRNEAPFRGSWSFAGGNFDVTDVDLYNCAIREAREEFFYRNSLAFEAIPSKVWNGSRRVTFNFRVFNWHAYFVNITGLDIEFDKHPREIADIQWFAIDNLPPKTLPLVRFELFLAKRRGYFN